MCKAGTLTVASVPDIRDHAQGQQGESVTGHGQGALSRKAVDGQKSAGIEPDGTIRAADLVAAGANSSVRIQKAIAHVGGNVISGARLLDITSAKRFVTVDLDVSRRGYAELYAPVTVTLPDDADIVGSVTDIRSVAIAGTGQDADKRTITVEIEVDTDGGGWDGAPVRVAFSGDVHNDVLLVPVNALIGLTSSADGVEVIKGTERHYVPVTTGLSSEATVEVQSDQLREGDTVVIPS